MTSSLYPLVITPIFHPKIWGGKDLQEFVEIPKTDLIGEVSLLTDNEPGGVGSKISNGWLEGKSLRDVFVKYTVKLVGPIAASRQLNRFPLILKLIHAAKPLSIQVHPNASYALKEHKLPFGKTEAWLILKKKNDSYLNIGFNRDVNRKIIKNAVENGELENLLNSYKVEEGQTFFIPPGQVHSIGPDIVLVEIQQNAPITYRLYDYKRKDPKTGNERHLDVSKALDVLDYNQTSRAIISSLTYNEGENDFSTFTACKYFCGQMITLRKGIEIKTDSSFVILVPINGRIQITPKGKDNFKSVIVNKGETILLPAYPKKYYLNKEKDAVKVMKFFIPDLKELYLNLHNNGFEDDEIRNLAGYTLQNDFDAFITS